MTGAAGMIGSAVVRYLESDGHEVITTDRVAADRAPHVVIDLATEDPTGALRGLEADAVIHLAGAVAGDLHTLVAANVLATTHLLEALPGGTRIVSAGSAAEYGAGDGSRLTETSPLAPLSPYGWSKAVQSTAASLIARQRGHRLSVVRPFNVVGPHLPPTTALGNIRRQLRSGDTPIRVGNLDVVRDYVTVAFVAAVFAETAKDDLGPEVIHAASGTGIRLGDVLASMIDLTDTDPEIAQDRELASLPAAPAVIGDPRMAAERYDLSCDIDAPTVARSVLQDFR